MVGIYKITNKLNGKCYIGQSVNIEHRWIEHKSRALHLSKHSCTALYFAIRKYGIDNFQFEVIEETSIDKLNEREIYWINYFNSYYNGYNETLGGEGNITYDYLKIFELWEQGYNCKEIEKIMGCSDQVITRALRANNISMEEVKKRINQTNKIIAIDIKTLQPLKIFHSKLEAAYFLGYKYGSTQAIQKAIDNHYRFGGYYWDFLNENNYPTKELSDEEFLQYRQEKMWIKTQEQREQISTSLRKVNRCSRDELKQLIRTTPFVKIGKQFGVSDNAIRKWCDFYNLPRRICDIKKYTDEEWATI